MNIRDKFSLCPKYYKENSFSVWGISFLLHSRQLNYFKEKHQGELPCLPLTTLGTLHLHQETHTLPEMPHSLLDTMPTPSSQRNSRGDAYMLSLRLPTHLKSMKFSLQLKYNGKEKRKTGRNAVTRGIGM